MGKFRKPALALATALALAGNTWSAGAAETIRIAFIDPLSGPFATTGESGLRSFQYAVEELVNKKGGVLGGRKFEIEWSDPLGVVQFY